MAKRRGKTQRGGGDLDQQIERLKEKVGAKGLKAAKVIVAENEPDVIKLAFKLCPKQTSIGLGKRIEAMLDNMPKTQADEYRATLLAAKG